MKLTREKITIMSVLVVAVLVLAGFTLLLIKDRTYFHTPQYTPGEELESDILVVYYSRSGNTEAMAREIARTMNTHIVKIEAKSYSLDFRGWRNASHDAWAKNKTEISPEVADLTPYRLIFMGAPIWWYRPAPPLWTFVDKNDFTDKSVILFSTFNSSFRAMEIEEFKKQIEQKGGTFVDHVYIRRGRVFYQKSGKELILETQTLLDAKVPKWEKIQ
ncbi:MAG: flavodoxin/nitric oxide synthase [Proteobacteria bacterium]|nr:flavodoxin/nitric oxide synthase [Pseudomonadota bacterium]